MYATAAAALLACLVCVNGLPAALYPRGNLGGATLLDCILAGNDPLNPYRCRPTRQEVVGNLRQEKSQSSEESSAGSDEVNKAPALTRQTFYSVPNCRPGQIFVFEINMCQDVVPFPPIKVASLGQVSSGVRSDDCPPGEMMTEALICMPISGGKPKQPTNPPSKGQAIRNKEKNKKE